MDYFNYNKCINFYMKGKCLQVKIDRIIINFNSKNYKGLKEGKMERIEMIYNVLN